MGNCLWYSNFESRQY